MKFAAVLAFAAVALAAADQEDDCEGITVGADCYAMEDCSWCTAGAVDDACHNTAIAKRLPEGVFKCSEKEPVLEAESFQGFDELIKEVNSTTLSFGSCGNCGLTYQTCCVVGEATDAACECHLQPNGDGSSAKNCGTCGVAYRACCLGTAAAGREKCNCDIK